MGGQEFYVRALPLGGEKIAGERLHRRRHFCHIRVDGVSVGVYEQNAAVCVVALYLRENVVERRTERD